MVFSSINNSLICRLCAEESENGCFLYSENENEQNLSKLINTYLPIKLTDDGILPQTICPGCNIQLEATMEFINLIIKGQKLLRELIQSNSEKYKLVINEDAEQRDPELLVCENKAQDWKIFMDTFKIHYKIPDELAVSAYRPDILVYSRCLKKVILIELTVPWETNIPKDHNIKSNKYFYLTNEITRNGFKTQLYAVEVGARGIPAKSLHHLLKDLGLPRTAVGTFMERVSRMGLTGSYNIWLSREGSEHSAVNPETVYPEKHPMVLQAQGLDKPKRKRGRPKKVKLVDEPFDVIELPPDNIDPLKEIEVSGKRKRKTPSRFKEAVQGKELERIFIQEGMTDGEESEGEEDNKPPAVVPKPGPGEVIGHSEVSGELVVMVKGKGRGRPKGGRIRSNKEMCVICGMEFSCVGRYMCHVAQHGRVRYRCATCGQTNDTRLSHEQHQSELLHEGLEVIHMDMEPKYEEPKSGEPKSEEPNDFDNTGEPTEEVTHETIPGISLPTLDLDTAEPTNMSDETLQPHTVSITVENEELLIEEKSIAGEMISNVYNSIEEVETHNNTQVSEEAPPKILKKESKEKIKPKANRLECNHCDKVFANKQSKSMHMKARHKGERPYNCSICGASFPYPRSLTLHMVTHRRNDASAGYACDLCGKVLNHPSSVVYHKESEHGGQSYACGKCGKSFKHKQLLQRHQLVHSQSRPFKCKLCDSKFKTKANLLNHQSLHSGIKKFPCNLCNQKFAHKTSLTLHMRWHTGDKPYACSECNKGFTQKGNLAEHLRIHTGEKPFSCQHCPRTFTTSSQHKLHLRRHTGERPFACQHCGKQFVSRESWRGHVRREGSARRHRCECGRAFAERHALAKHTRAHTGERPFRCAHCPRTFADRSNRNKHMRQMHKLTSLLASPPPPPAPTDELEERVIFVTYDMNDEHNALHILDPEQEETLKSIEEEGALTSVYSGASMLTASPRAPSPALYYDDEEQHVTVTDEEGNPIHFTMQDGTQLAITTLDGKSLQVITHDGQTIPVEINQFTNEEEVQSTDDITELSLSKSLEEDVPTVAQYFSIV